MVAEIGAKPLGEPQTSSKSGDGRDDVPGTRMPPQRGETESGNKSRKKRIDLSRNFAGVERMVRTETLLR